MFVIGVVGDVDCILSLVRLLPDGFSDRRCTDGIEILVVNHVRMQLQGLVWVFDEKSFFEGSIGGIGLRDRSESSSGRVEGGTHIFVVVDQLVPLLGVGGLHEGLGDFSLGVAAGLLDGGHESFGLGHPRALLRLLLTPTLGGFELAHGVEVVELGSQLHEAVEAGQVQLVWLGSVDDWTGGQLRAYSS